ncbi:MAG: hypothetical protein JKY65_25975 [Planctomycetes bacterium]|nr:hypothetical protein [Planctomycetota bacterium]
MPRATNTAYYSTRQRLVLGEGVASDLTRRVFSAIHVGAYVEACEVLRIAMSPQVHAQGDLLGALTLSIASAALKAGHDRAKVIEWLPDLPDRISEEALHAHVAAARDHGRLLVLYAGPSGRSLIELLPIGLFGNLLAGANWNRDGSPTTLRLDRVEAAIVLKSGSANCTNCRGRS